MRSEKGSSWIFAIEKAFEFGFGSCISAFRAFIPLAEYGMSAVFEKGADASPVVLAVFVLL